MVVQYFFEMMVVVVGVVVKEVFDVIIGRFAMRLRGVSKCLQDKGCGFGGLYGLCSLVVCFSKISFVLLQITSAKVGEALKMIWIVF